MRKILIATDGSPEAREATEYGLELAAEQEATAILLQVIPPLDWSTSSAERSSARFRRARDAAEIARDEATTLSEEHGVPVRSEVVAGDPADEIVAYADNHDVDLTVVGSRGAAPCAARCSAACRRPSCTTRAARCSSFAEPRSATWRRR